MSTCKHCSGSGKYYQYISPYLPDSTGDLRNFYEAVDCKFCSGTGYINPEETFNNVPRKYIRDEYFEER